MATLQVLDPSFQMPTDYEGLLKVYKKAAKAADQRLVRLERLSGEDNFKTAKQYSYAKAMRAIKEWSGEEATRFNTKAPKTVAGLKEKIADISDFLKAKSSTKTGLKNVHLSRAKKLNERYGTNFSVSEWDTFLNSELMKKLDSKYGYGGTKDEVIATLVQDKDNIVDAVNNANDIEIYADDEMVETIVNDLLEENGEDVLKAFGETAGTKTKKNVGNRKSATNKRNSGKKK